MEINNIDKLVNTVTQNVLNKINCNNNSKSVNKSCLILLQNMVFGIKEYLDYIKENYRGYEFYLGTAQELSKVNYIDNNSLQFIEFNLANSDFLNLLNSVEVIIVLGLRINQMKAIIETDDSDDINHIILSSLMVNKPLYIMINSNELMFNKISNQVNAIQKMGINVINIQKTNSQPNKVNLITESYVMNIKESGLKEIVLGKKQLITPLAKDKLREFKIKIKYNEEEIR
ncbi:hypothetical protein RI065_09930 [Mycoplasmatota bacterium zrk1]